mmetsp:Transcript_69802/g.227049  ORF Transcript_69802/g.227049 Transcript_69802/m.227049 type:complete len:303 (-) Transcript_69802:2129-3037(-)
MDGGNVVCGGLGDRSQAKAGLEHRYPRFSPAVEADGAGRSRHAIEQGIWGHPSFLLSQLRRPPPILHVVGRAPATALGLGRQVGEEHRLPRADRIEERGRWCCRRTVADFLVVVLDVVLVQAFSIIAPGGGTPGVSSKSRGILRGGSPEGLQQTAVHSGAALQGLPIAPRPRRRPCNRCIRYQLLGAQGVKSRLVRRGTNASPGLGGRLLRRLLGGAARGGRAGAAGQLRRIVAPLAQKTFHRILVPITLCNSLVLLLSLLQVLADHLLSLSHLERLPPSLPSHTRSDQVPLVDHIFAGLLV